VSHEVITQRVSPVIFR